MKSTITVDFFENEKTGLFVGLSEDMPGLFVAGKTLEEVEAKIPGALKMLVAAKHELARERAEKLKSRKPQGFKTVARQREFAVAA
ncbi:type II toxin-antitoxin system HicB family antitoxin [Aureimonas phyllosphaerae]|uniref:Putative RNase H-like HicB family nuclease n=1 Tax=Aureimonas phyllosphaerae TaxID=1166078 RepID=A0A7W6FST2_9HYPH|nr:hypothetical protein [Aureimonas phyllosphaerae]MBB3934293.1 putative RNase H-like HicB family nuclease [Aureimonas phyllosphaerae]MBB3958491.1 putative RNase H-like HicB family nuclease [Aureimonas phyllosphaerae]SFE97867.1 hypothetical protein SAMN05216566_101467 [Aureimonas phyllosphaerae]